MKNRFLKTAVYLLGFLYWSNTGHSQQVSIQFNPAVYGQSLEGLCLAQLMSTYPQDMSARISIKVREAKAGHVVTVLIPVFNLRQGGNSIDRVSFSKARFQFGNNTYGIALSQSGRFPEGEYEYCYEVDLSDSKTAPAVPFYENCFVQELQPMTPLLLLNPVDGDEDCNKRPQFIWQPPLPLPMDARFRLLLVEVGEKQDIVEAINFNPPLINQGNIPINQLSFPVNLPDLKEDRRYAWQVTVYTGTVILKKSEIWTYTVKCTPLNVIPSTDSYRELKENEDGNFYVADRILRFSLNNPYSEGQLNYRINSLSNPSLVIRNLPKLNLRPGINRYDLDLSDRKDLKNGEEYLLIVRFVNGRELKLRFTYKNE
jgi:hypothetical protein